MGHLKKIYYFILLTLLITSCGTYQYSGYINDGIYQANEPNEKYADAADEITDKKQNNEYFKSSFNEMALAYTQTESNDQLFTDVENYRTSENDSINETYGPWGENKNSVVIQINSNYNDGFWSRWRYPNWMWNYGYGYGNVWGYGYNNYWTRPFPFHGGLYDPFNPFWGYYDSFYYGYGYAYNGYYPWWRPYNSWYNNSYYSGRNWNTPVSLISGRRGSRNAISSRSNTLVNSNIRDNFNRNNPRSLNDRLTRIDKINQAARINPNYYNKPFNSGSANSLSKPSSKPNGNYSRPSNSNYSRPSNSDYSKPSSNSYKPSGSSNYSSPSYSRPSYSPSSSSSSRSGGMSSGASPSSRGGKSGR